MMMIMIMMLWLEKMTNKAMMVLMMTAIVILAMKEM